MLDFRKTLLTFAAVGLFAGVANAQVATLTNLTSSTGSLAVEGVTEQLPNITVNFTNGGGVSGATLVLTANVPFSMASSNGTLDAQATLGTDTTLTPTITEISPTSVQIVFSSIPVADQ